MECLKGNSAISSERVDMKTRPILLTFALGLGLFGDVLSATEYTYALASRGCMRNDAPALEIYLTQEPYSGEAPPPKPYLRIEIAWGDWGKLVGKDLKLAQIPRRKLDPQTPIVHASLNLERRTPVWLQGTLRLKKVEVNKEVEGSYEFAGPNDLKSTGTFKAQWGKDGLPCG
jgi:hypothetical protein